MKRALIAGAVLLLALASGIWVRAVSEEDPAGRSRDATGAESSEAEASEDPDPRSAVSQILSRRAQAVMDDDKRAFLSSIDPTARRFRKKQGKIFESLTSLRLGTYELRQQGDKDHARPEHERRYKSADGVFIPTVEESYRFKGYDDADFVSSLFFTFVLRDGKWLVAADDDLKGRNTTERTLWDYGPVVQSRGKNVTLIQHPCREAGCVELGDSFMRQAERARRKVKLRWKGPWNGHVVVLATSSRREVRRIIDVDYGISNFAAFAYSPYRDAGYSPARIIVDRSTLGGHPPDIVELILTHEMAHVATRRASGPHVPLWLEEGLAEWMARVPGDGADLYFANQVASGAIEPRLATDRQFRKGNAEELFLQYQSSRSAVAYFIERWGYGKFVHFYKALGDSHNKYGSRAKHLRSEMRRFTGLSLSKLERQWADSI
jgi:hypothetical protein